MKLVRKLNSLEIIRLIETARVSPLKESLKIKNVVFQKMSWIAALAAAKYKRFQNYDDLLQVGQMALYRAILSFDNTKSSNIFAYVYPWVKTDVRREAWKEKQYLANYEFVADSRNDLDDLVSSPEDVYLEVERSKVLTNILNKLDINSRTIMYKSLGLEGVEPESLRDIAEEMNMSHETIRQIRNKAVAKIAEVYAAT